jgi:hypothetical protein
MSLRTRIANLLMPWAAANATAWPSTHAVHAELLAQLKEQEDFTVTGDELDRCLERAEQAEAEVERLRRRLAESA